MGSPVSRPDLPGQWQQQEGVKLVQAVDAVDLRAGFPRVLIVSAFQRMQSQSCVVQGAQARIQHCLQHRCSSNNRATAKPASFYALS